MGHSERNKSIFVTVFTSTVMGIIGLWLAWVLDAERWDLFTIYCAGLALLIYIFWDYRD